MFLLPMHRAFNVLSVFRRSVRHFMAEVRCRLTCFSVAYFRFTIDISALTATIPKWSVSSLQYHNLFWLPSCGDSHFERARAPHTHRIPLSVVSALRHCSMHIEITWFIFIHLSPKISWRSTVVAHFRFNKNVFIYIDASDDDNDGYAHGAFWCRAHKITNKKDANVHHVDGGNCNVLDIHSRCLRQFRSAGHLIQMRELVW